MSIGIVDGLGVEGIGHTVRVGRSTWQTQVANQVPAGNPSLTAVLKADTRVLTALLLQSATPDRDLRRRRRKDRVGEVCDWIMRSRKEDREDVNDVLRRRTALICLVTLI